MAAAGGDVKQTLFYVEDWMNNGERDELTATKLYQQSFPETFKEAFDQVRKQNKLSIERTAELMRLRKRLFKMSMCITKTGSRSNSALRMRSRS